MSSTEEVDFKIEVRAATPPHSPTVSGCWLIVWSVVGGWWLVKCKF